MFQSASNILSLLLIVATTLVGITPAVGVCESKRGAKQCCGRCQANPSEASSTCCSKSAKPQACQCSVEQERPATPQERRTSDERNNARRAECMAVVLPSGDDQPPAPAIEDAALLSSQPESRRQAVLCRWLT